MSLNSILVTQACKNQKNAHVNKSLMFDTLKRHLEILEGQQVLSILNRQKDK